MNIYVNAGCCTEETLLGGVECDVASGAIGDAGLVVEVETCGTGLTGIWVTCAGCTGSMAQSADIRS